jgi:hypothetical protein
MSARDSGNGKRSKTMTTEHSSDQAALEHAWRYFEIHASQRMSMFNYFLVLFGLVAAGLGGCLQASGSLRMVGAVLGAALAVVAWTFWKLDQRSSFLVKHAEVALREIELRALPQLAHLFREEKDHTVNVQMTASRPMKLWTYGRSFRLIFASAGVVGVAGVALSFAMYSVDPNSARSVAQPQHSVDHP